MPTIDKGFEGMVGWSAMTKLAMFLSAYVVFLLLKLFKRDYKL